MLALFVPILTACRVRWAGTPDQFVELVRLLERFSFRVYRIEGNWRSQAARNVLFRIASKVWQRSLGFERDRHAYKAPCPEVSPRRSLPKGI